MGVEPEQRDPALLVKTVYILVTRCVRCLVVRTPARSVRGAVAETRHTHTDYRVLWRRRDCTATLSRGEHPNLSLDRLLLLFLAHYLEDGPHLLYTGCFWWLPFTENKGKDVANYIKKEGYLQM